MPQVMSTWLAIKTITLYLSSSGQIHADVAELADALDSGSSALTGVEVQVLSSALFFTGLT